MTTTEPETMTVHVGGTTDAHLIGELVEGRENGHTHWTYTLPNGYRSPFHYGQKVSAAVALVHNQLAARESGFGVVPRVEPIEGAEGVDGHAPVFEVYQCPPGCPEHPPVIVCGRDGETWPCAPVALVVGELEHQARDMDCPDGVPGCGDRLRARAHALRSAGGRI